jgi:hypothetical protein
LIKNYYVHILHQNNGRLKETDVCGVVNFSHIISDGLSCIVDEIIKKSLIKPGKMADESVFIPSYKDIEAYKERQKKLLANEKSVKQEGTEGVPKAIITQDNKDPHRLKKMVTFLHEEARGPSEQQQLQMNADGSASSLTETE